MQPLNNLGSWSWILQCLDNTEWLCLDVRSRMYVCYNKDNEWLEVATAEDPEPKPVDSITGFGQSDADGNRE